jgi:glyoxylase-like metal-dependent hydrolase (beta-lactamase superfamily II)
MQLHVVETGRFKLDGGAMFGVVPKTIWSKTNPSDAENRIDMAMRCLLIADGNRVILVDNGLGNKYDAKFAQLYDLDDRTTNLEASLKALGIGKADVTDLVLTHLHFDHCGGTTEIDPATGKARMAFPNADIWVQRSHLQWALNPNAREKASFFTDNIQPIANSPRLKLLDGPQAILPGVDLVVVNGHTDGMQLPLIRYKGKQILYAADLFPTAGHIPLPYVMAYDTRPLLTLQEREQLMPTIAKEQWVLFYEHDPVNECGTIAQDDKGRYKSAQTFKLSAL